MNKGFIAILSFAAGAAAGYFTAKKILEDHYAQLAQEEIDSVKERIRSWGKDIEEKNPPEKKTVKVELDRDTYVHYARDLGYTEEPEPAKLIKPHVISPDEFGELPEYDKISLTYYADGVVARDNYKVMSDDEIEETIGRESLTHFGEYEDDSVFVRNDDLKADYEILLDEKKYSEYLA